MSILQTMLESTNRLTLIASLPANDFELCQAAVEAGSDVLKLHINVEHRASGRSFGSLEENLDVIQRVVEDLKLPVGIVPGDDLRKVQRTEIDKLIELGIDFVSMYAHHTPAWLLAERRIAKFLAIGNEYARSEIAQMQELDIAMIEASIMEPEAYGMPLSARDLMHYRDLTAQSTKPIVVPTQKHIQVEDLGALHSTGVKGLMIGAIVMGTDATSIFKATESFRKHIDAL